MDEKNIAPNYNLDEGSEYFTFTVKGHNYKFRYPTLEEADKFKEVAEDDEKARELIFKYVEPVDEKTPPIKDIFMKLNIKESQRFLQMITTEFNG